ncbi:phage tail protein [Pseudoflavitalea rhizosphaerae]|uniref:phage tail protein n=1 Tax=Pseudoflavitalea rhizosphaerae TaxID=1884793 RepID=UPI000F8D7916|nr:tail fiber protein [Pseudoflavitalea rhizosphaerae]
MEGVLAYVTLFAGNFAPRNWATCEGQILAISSNTALFSLLGTNYGGNGQTTFGLPDLRGRAVVGAGQGPGLSPYDLGQAGGSENTTLLTSEIPLHTHGIQLAFTPKCSSVNGNTGGPANTTYAPLSSGANAFSGVANAKMKSFDASVVTGPNGNGQPFSNRNPYLALNYIICLQGVFPQRP